MGSVATGIEEFSGLLWAEWDRLRRGRGYVAGLVAGALVTVLIGLYSAAGSYMSCGGSDETCPEIPVGPGGEAVSDKFYFVHQPLTGDGSITARVSSLTGLITYPPPDHDEIVPGVVPWAKAGLILKESTVQGAAYAAVMLTGSHGTRMQANFTEDLPGRPGTVSADAPRWLRLTRSGDTVTGYESADGEQWTRIGAVDLSGLPDTVQVGLFVTSPCDLTVRQGALGGLECRYTEATARFDEVHVEGETPDAPWMRDDIGVTMDGEVPHHPGGVVASDGAFTVTGSGDIAPLVSEGRSIEDTLNGTVAGAALAIWVAVMFAGAGAQRGRALAARAVVMGGASFVAGLVAAAVALPLGERILRANGNYVLPVSLATEARVVAGTAALFSVAALFALALASLLRRRRLAFLTALATLVVPYLLASAPFLPVEAARWLLRLTPAAAFAIQQSLPAYPQVTNLYAPQTGYYPLPPWAGLAVLCAYTALALLLAARPRTAQAFDTKRGMS